MEALSQTQLLTSALANFPTFVLVLVGILINNHRLNDVRDLLRAEAAKNHSELLVKFSELDHRIGRLERQRWKP